MALTALISAACAVGCGDNSDPPKMDGGMEPNRLEVLTPPGDAIGMSFSTTELLRVQYIRDDGAPIRGEELSFSILTAGVEADGGSTLVTDRAITNREGIAEVELQSGAEQVNFRVEVSAPNATPAVFFIAVAEGGFARIDVTTSHMGPRDTEAMSAIELRMYRPTEMRCANSNPDDMPLSLFPPRQSSEFGNVATFQNMVGGQDYVVVAWTTTPPSTTPISFGCIELSAAHVPQGTILIDITAFDRSVRAPAALPIEIHIDLSPHGSLVAAEGHSAAWDVLSCPVGRGQLLLDCTLDAAVPDGALDCIVNGSGGLVDLVDGARGALDGDGCRAIGGLEQTLDDGVGATFPAGMDLDALLLARNAITDSLIINSTLTWTDGIAAHTLATAQVGMATPEDLAATARPIITARLIEISTTPEGSPAPTATLAEHGFTLDLDQLQRNAFAESLAGQPQALLGTVLFQTVEDGANTGCDAVSDLLCTAAGQAAGCAIAACASGAAGLDTELNRWWRASVSPGIDFRLVGSAPVYDFDDDLVVESLGRDLSDIVSGSFTASIDTTEGSVTNLAATAATPAP